MQKGILIVFFFFGIVIQSYSQANFVDSGSLTFETEVEKEIWTLGAEDPFQFFKAVKATSAISDEKWTNLVKELSEKASKNPDQLSLLRTIFQKSHQRLFKKYEQHSSFSTMLTTGKYDCVSGTAVLGMLLEKFGFEFDILETDYHIFIQVIISGKPVILESTLPVGGMITSPSEVEKYLSSYLPKNEGSSANVIQTGLSSPDKNLQYSIFRKVNLIQLAGLQYYNDAIVHFNQQAYGVAINQLSKAFVLYPSERIDALRELSIDLAYKTYGYNFQMK